MFLFTQFLIQSIKNMDKCPKKKKLCGNNQHFVFRRFLSYFGKKSYQHNTPKTRVMLKILYLSFPSSRLFQAFPLRPLLILTKTKVLFSNLLGNDPRIPVWSFTFLVPEQNIIVILSIIWKYTDLYQLSLRNI